MQDIITYPTQNTNRENGLIVISYEELELLSVTVGVFFA